MALKTKLSMKQTWGNLSIFFIIIIIIIIIIQTTIN